MFELIDSDYELADKEIRERLFWHVRTNYKTNKLAARDFGVSDPTMSLVLKGERSLNPAMLSAIGYKKVVEKTKTVIKYVRTDENESSLDQAVTA